MTWKNSATGFGRISKLLHWSIALIILGLTGLGWYMVDLTYYDRWYHDSLSLHKAFGMIVLFFAAIRLIWVAINIRPTWPISMKGWERVAARLTHKAFYLLMLLIPITGYVISTSSGDPISIFDLWKLPALFPVDEFWRELAINLHYYCAYGLLALTLLHTLAALKHQLVNKDGLLKKML